MLIRLQMKLEKLKHKLVFAVYGFRMFEYKKVEFLLVSDDRIEDLRGTAMLIHMNPRCCDNTMSPR